MRHWAFGAFVWVISFLALRWLVSVGNHSDDFTIWGVGIFFITVLSFKAVEWHYDEGFEVHYEIRGNKTIKYVDYSKLRRKLENRGRPRKPAVPKPKIARRPPVMTCPKCKSEYWTVLGTTDRRITTNRDELYECHGRGCDHTFRADDT